MGSGDRFGVCRRGHSLFYCNSVLIRHSQNGKQYRRCLRCHAIRQIAYRARKSNIERPALVLATCAS